MLSIGALSASSGVKIPTIRYYEETGLLPPPARGANGRRIYEPAMVARLRFIRHARELGFEPGAIAELLALSDQGGGACAAADEIAARQLAAIRSRLARLQALEAELSRMLSGCHEGLQQCHVLEVLADHAHCRHHDSDPALDLRQPV